jgi:hypothetical protein
VCADSLEGQETIVRYNLLYSAYLGNPDYNSTYDWCNCSGGGLSGGTIAGIVIGSVAGAALIGVLVYWFCCRKRQFDSYAAS